VESESPTPVTPATEKGYYYWRVVHIPMNIRLLMFVEMCIELVGRGQRAVMTKILEFDFLSDKAMLFDANNHFRPFLIENFLIDLKHNGFAIVLII
jgi:hypothetical protein